MVGAADAGHAAALAHERGGGGPSSRFGPSEILGAQEIFSVINPYEKYALGLDQIPGGPGPRAQVMGAGQFIPTNLGQLAESFGVKVSKALRWPRSWPRSLATFSLL